VSPSKIIRSLLINFARLQSVTKYLLMILKKIII